MNLSYHPRNQFFVSFCSNIILIILNVIFNQEAYSQPRVSLTASHLLRELKVDCKKNGLEVQLWFKQPFLGVAYSLGFYDKMDCRYISNNYDDLSGGHTNYSFSRKFVVYVTTTSALLIQVAFCIIVYPLYRISFHFLIPVDGCGTTYGVKSFGTDPHLMINNSTFPMKTDEVHMENTLLIQGDAEIQEQGDLAQKLRCVWQKEIHKPLIATLPLSQGFQRIHPQKNSNVNIQTQRKGNIEILPNSKKNWSRRSDNKDQFPHYNYNQHTVQKIEQSFINRPSLTSQINSQNEPKALAQIQTENLTNSISTATTTTSQKINSFLFTLTMLVLFLYDF